MSDFGQSIAGSRGTPRTRPGVTNSRTDNASKNAAALKQLSQLEIETGHDEAWWADWNRKQRESVRQRFGSRAT